MFNIFLCEILFFLRGSNFQRFLGSSELKFLRKKTNKQETHVHTQNFMPM